MNDTAEQTKPAEEKKAVVPLNERAKEILTPAMGEIMKALPPSLKPEKFEAAFVTAVVTNSDILRCSQASLRSALLKCAVDGLMPDGKRAALVPHWNAKKGQLEATYVPMARGIMDRAGELGGVISITAECVYANDTFECDLADPEKTHHPFNGFAFDRGDVVGAYAIFRAKGGQVIHRELMPRADIDKARNASKMKSSKVWDQWFSEMVRKTVIRRGSKYVPMSSELRQIIERDDEHAVFKDEKPDDWNPLKDDLDHVIDVEPEEEDLPSESDVNLGERMTGEIDAINSLEELREWQETWSEVVAELHQAIRKMVLDTINIRTSQLENEND